MGSLLIVYCPGQGRRAVYGTVDGVYISDLNDPRREPSKVLALVDVTQVDVLEDYQLLIVLSGKCKASNLFTASE